MLLHGQHFQRVLYVQRDEHMTESFQVWVFRNLLPKKRETDIMKENRNA